MKVAFVCVNFNNSQITSDYIKNVNNINGDHEIKIVVVDNSSDERETELLQSLILHYKNVVIIRSEKNEGYFKGLNIGIHWGLTNGFDKYQVVGNNDLSFDPTFIDHLEGIKLSANEAVVAPDVLTINNIHQNPHVLSKMSALSKFKFDVFFSNYYLATAMYWLSGLRKKQSHFDNERKHIYMGIGAIYVLTPVFFSHFKKLWDDVFLYGEEALLAGQLASVNCKMLYEPALKCAHLESVSTNKIPSKKKYKIIQQSYKIYRKYL